MYNQNQNQSQNQSSGKIEVPESRAALDNMKYEIAGELGINLKQGYNGDLPSRQAGSIGGYMVKRLIEQAERQIAGKSLSPGGGMPCVPPSFLAGTFRTRPRSASGNISPPYSLGCPWNPFLSGKRHVAGFFF